MYTCDRERGEGGKGEGREGREGRGREGGGKGEGRGRERGGKGEGRGREGREGLLSVTDHTSKANPSTEHELKYLSYILF